MYATREISIGLKTYLLDFSMTNKQDYLHIKFKAFLLLFFLLSENKHAESLGVILVSVCINISNFILIVY